MEKILSVSKVFSRTPGSRYEKEGRFSGEEFRNLILYPAIKESIDNDNILVIDLDGTAGYGTSFLEESFGGLIRINKLDYDKILGHLKFVSKEEDYLIDDIKMYLKQANEFKIKSLV